MQRIKCCMNMCVKKVNVSSSGECFKWCFEIRSATSMPKLVFVWHSVFGLHHCVQKNSKKCDVSVLKSMIEYCWLQQSRWSVDEIACAHDADWLWRLYVVNPLQCLSSILKSLFSSQELTETAPPPLPHAPARADFACVFS